MQTPWRQAGVSRSFYGDLYARVYLLVDLEDLLEQVEQNTSEEVILNKIGDREK